MLLRVCSALALLRGAAGRVPAFSWDSPGVPAPRLAECRRRGALPARAHGLAGHLAPRRHRHAQGQGYMYGPKPTPGLGGEYGPASYYPAAFGAQYFEDAAEGAARAIHAANDGTVVLHYQNGDGALPFYRQSGVRAGHARRHGAARGGVPGVEARQRRHAATLPQLQLEPVLVARQGARPLGQALRERDLGPQAACWTAPSSTPTAARVEPGQREGLLRMARTIQAAALGTIVGLHASDSVRDRFTGVATAMQCTLAR